MKTQQISHAQRFQNRHEVLSDSCEDLSCTQKQQSTVQASNQNDANTAATAAAAAKAITATAEVCWWLVEMQALPHARMSS